MRKLCRSAAYTAMLMLISMPALAGKQPVTLDDYGALSYAWSPRISPDGERIAYLLDGQVIASNFDGTDATPLTEAETLSWGLFWAADSQSVYFLADRDGGSQLFRQDARGDSEALQVSNFKAGFASGNLSPDATQVVVSVSDNKLKSARGEERSGPFVVTRRSFRVDSGYGYIVDGDESHLHVVDLESGESRQLTSGRHSEGQADWSPDGSSIVFVSNREEEPDVGYRTDLWTIAANEPEAGIRRLTNSNHAKYRPSYSPDGETIAFLQAKDGPYGLYYVTVMPADGGEVRPLTQKFDRYVNGFRWSADGKWIYFAYEDSGATSLSRVNVESGDIEQVIAGNQAIGGFDVGGDGRVAVSMARGNEASAVYTHANGETSLVVDPNRDFLDSRALATKSKVRISTVGDTTIDVFISTPSGFDGSKPYPAVLRMHGGPQDQFAWGYSFPAQYYASRGYVVIEPNPRGSTGRGQAFLEANYRAWGVDDYDDVMAAVDYAIEAGLVDPDRLVATGYSYGGYLTNVVITRTNRFKAAASGAAEAHAEASFGHNVYTSWYMWELGYPWENRELYDVHAPFLRAGRIETPTIFLGGSQDWNQPIAGAEMMYQALRVRGIDTQLIVYPGVHHGGWGEEFEKDYYKRIVDWFDKYIKPESLDQEPE